VPSPEDHTQAELSQLIGKVETLGGTFTIEQLTFDVPTEEEYITNLLSRANQNTLRSLGSYHASQARDAYLQGDSMRIWKNVDRALRFPIEFIDANDIGYVLLAAGRFEEAAVLFRRTLDTKDIDDKLASLSLYNLAISQLGCMLLQEANEGLAEAQARLNSTSYARYGCQCLFVPSIVEDHCTLTEQADPELSEVIIEAQRALSSAQSAISTIEIRPFPWPIPNS
jgi:hypothetical protein